MSTQPHEIDAWLGDACTELTGEQLERFTAEVEVWVIAARYPDPDSQVERDAAMSATVQHLLGETTVAGTGAAPLGARIAASEATATAIQVARLAVLDGGTQAGVAREAGLDRMTVRKALGL